MKERVENWDKQFKKIKICSDNLYVYAKKKFLTFSNVLI